MRCGRLRQRHRTGPTPSAPLPLDRLKADTNPMTAVLDFSDALRDEPVEKIVARLPGLLRVKDLHELSAIVFLCLSGSRAEDRPRFADVIHGSIASTDDSARLLAIAYGAFAAAGRGLIRSTMRADGAYQRRVRRVEAADGGTQRAGRGRLALVRILHRVSARRRSVRQRTVIACAGHRRDGNARLPVPARARDAVSQFSSAYNAPINQYRIDFRSIRPLNRIVPC